jgi:putative toxin-antitoxin system antitoxin component (TIGR02293 family)
MSKSLEGFGYARLVGIKDDTLGGIRQALIRGLPFRAVEQFRALTNFPNKDIMGVMRMKPATYARRKATGRLSQEESERLLKATRIFSMAMQLYGGNKDAARVYFKHPSSKLDGETPMQLIITDDESARQVEDLLFAQLRGDVIG